MQPLYHVRVVELDKSLSQTTRSLNWDLPTPRFSTKATLSRLILRLWLRTAIFLAADQERYPVGDLALTLLQSNPKFSAHRRATG